MTWSLLTTPTHEFLPDEEGLRALSVEKSVTHELRPGQPSVITSVPTESPPSPPLLHDLLDGKSDEERKTYPVYEGVIGYFRDAIYRLSRVSYDGNQQHNAGQHLHWARGKSTDQRNCVMRHLMAGEEYDYSDEAEKHIFSRLWRDMADAQLYLERKYNIRPPVNARTSD